MGPDPCIKKEAFLLKMRGWHQGLMVTQGCCRIVPKLPWSSLGLPLMVLEGSHVQQGLLLRQAAGQGGV